MSAYEANIPPTTRSNIISSPNAVDRLFLQSIYDKGNSNNSGTFANASGARPFRRRPYRRGRRRRVHVQRRRCVRKAARGAAGRLRELPPADRNARCLVLEDLLPQGRIGPPATSGRGDRTTEGRASTDGLDNSTRLAHPFALTSSGRSSSGSRSRAGQSRCARGARRYGVVPGKRELRARYLDPLQSGIPRAVLHSPIIL